MATTLLDLLASSLRRRPHAEALVCGQRRVSYLALWNASMTVAACLRRRGLQPGDRVALLLEPSPEYVAGYYGVLAAGGMAVALNPLAKEWELAAWLRHSGARWLLCAGRTRQCEALAGECPQLDMTELGLWRRADTALSRPPTTAEPDAPAAIIYTSGTTGAPKGVTLSHRNLVSNVTAVMRYLQLTPADRVMHVLPFCYSYGNSVLHTHLAAGATVIIEPGLMYPHRLLERMAEERATGFSGVPATYALLLARTRLDAYPLDSLRYLTQAGGPMPLRDILLVREQLPWAAFYVMYGQTEATARLSYLPPALLLEKPGSVGVAIADTELAVCDPDGRRLPPGEEGQVCARGPGVMLGYWQDPEATRQVLHNGWLWTGDLGHMDEQGFLYLHGRASELIKVGAYRINPAEIEEVLLAMEGVAEVAAAGVPDPLLGQAIKVWLVPQPQARLQAKQVLAYCRRHLPIYKLPRQVVFTDALPRTASGKLRRHALMEAGTAGLED